MYLTLTYFWVCIQCYYNTKKWFLFSEGKLSFHHNDDDYESTLQFINTLQNVIILDYTSTGKE